MYLDRLFKMMAEKEARTVHLCGAPINIKINGVSPIATQRWTSKPSAGLPTSYDQGPGARIRNEMEMNFPISTAASATSGSTFSGSAARSRW